LPIIETQAGDISAYIPTNVISITDGQIFMETNLVLPGYQAGDFCWTICISCWWSCSNQSVKSVAKGLRIDWRSLENWPHSLSLVLILDKETRQRIERGQRLTEVLKQPQYSPKSVWQMYAILLLSCTSGCFDQVPLDKIKNVEANLLRELKSKSLKEMEKLTQAMPHLKMCKI
jgi:F-type H+/Na+-transporting ATPase subunit alpha